MWATRYSNLKSSILSAGADRYTGLSMRSQVYQRRTTLGNQLTISGQEMVTSACSTFSSEASNTNPPSRIFFSRPTTRLRASICPMMSRDLSLALIDGSSGTQTVQVGPGCMAFIKRGRSSRRPTVVHRSWQPVFGSTRSQ